MKIEQIYTGCLAQGAYYIESNGEAVVIDPLREVEPYISRAEKDKAKIKRIFNEAMRICNFLFLKLTWSSYHNEN